MPRTSVSRVPVSSNLGIVIVAGCKASDDNVMRFSVQLPKDNAILMLLTTFVIVLIGVSVATGDRAAHHVEAISIVGAVALLITYAVWVVFYLEHDRAAVPLSSTV